MTHIFHRYEVQINGESVRGFDHLDTAIDWINREGNAANARIWDNIYRRAWDVEVINHLGRAVMLYPRGNFDSARRVWSSSVSGIVKDGSDGDPIL